MEEDKQKMSVILKSMSTLPIRFIYKYIFMFDLLCAEKKRHLEMQHSLPLPLDGRFLVFFLRQNTEMFYPPHIPAITLHSSYAPPISVVRL